MNLYYKLFVFIAIYFIDSVCSRSYSTNADMVFIKLCNETSSISLLTMNQVLINKKLSGNETSEFKCFLHCLFTKYGWMDEDGGFLLTEMRSVLDETSIDLTTLEFVLYKCTANPSVDRCQRAFQFTECFWHKVKDIHTDDAEDVLVYNLDEEKKIKPRKYFLLP